METMKQKKIAGVIQQALSEIFQRENLSMVNGGMVTISEVSVTPDLLIAKIYLSLYQIKDQKKLLEDIEKHSRIAREAWQENPQPGSAHSGAAFLY